MGAIMCVPVGVVISVAVEKENIEICYSNFESRKRKVKFSYNTQVGLLNTLSKS